ncbi:MAG: HAD family hydrolase [Elusimicrobiota bacterium]|jgi:histidinol-phosphate phosphatase family protein|nr:HAD family hydrolase [Elusimicrobiota bacterium]
MKVPAVFLDRDGTLIYDKHYLKVPQQVKLYAYCAESINKLKNAGYKVIVVTNQSGIARGMFSEHELGKVHDYFVKMLEMQGAKVDDIFYCPHIDEDNCKCRKPKTGMVLQAQKKHGIDIKKSFVVGDHIRDYQLGFNMGGKGILILTGHGKKQVQKIPNESIKPFAICRTLKQAVNLILKHKEK